MSESTSGEAWQRIADILERDEKSELEAYLDELTPGEVARAISRLGDEMATKAIGLLDPGDAADLIEELPDAQGAHVLEELPLDAAVHVVEELVSDERADILSEMKPQLAEAIIEKMEATAAQDVRRLLTYEPNTAGGLMITEYLSFPENTTIHDVLQDMRANAEQYEDYGVQYVYVTDTYGKLCGVIRLRDLVVKSGKTLLTDIMIRDPVSVRYDTPLDELEQIFDRNAFVGLPVVDEQYRLIGIVMREAVEEAHGEQAEESFRRFSGIIGGEEFRTMPWHQRSIRRLSFLTPNIVLNLIAASVIALFTETLEAVILLAVFLPIISDMSGCSGNQAVAVSIRELSLGITKPRDFLVVLWKECQVGIANGIMIGFTLGLVAIGYGFVRQGLPLPYGPIVFGGVVGVALAVNTLVAVMLGGLIPLGLKGVGIDPALAAAPILTTVTDMCGFFFVLGLASLALSFLV